MNCLACATPCSSCYSSPYICNQCVSGYNLYRGLCISLFNFTLTLVLDPPPNSTFIDNYNYFLQEVAKAAKVDVSSISVIAIWYSSVNIEMLVSSDAAPNTPAAAEQIAGFANLAKSSTIANMNVISASNITVNTPPLLDNNNSSSNNNNNPNNNNGNSSNADSSSSSGDSSGGGISEGAIIALGVCIPVGAISIY